MIINTKDFMYVGKNDNDGVVILLYYYQCEYGVGRYGIYGLLDTHRWLFRDSEAPQITGSASLASPSQLAPKPANRVSFAWLDVEPAQSAQSAWLQDASMPIHLVVGRGALMSTDRYLCYASTVLRYGERGSLIVERD